MGGVGDSSAKITLRRGAGAIVTGTWRRYSWWRTLLGGDYICDEAGDDENDDKGGAAAYLWKKLRKIRKEKRGIKFEITFCNLK